MKHQINIYKRILKDKIEGLNHVVWNNKETIKAAINSVLAQVYKDIEYIVIDGRSTDGTVNAIEEYRDKIAIFLSESDKGLYDALNKGIKMSTGDVIAILHSDDVFYDENVVSDMVERMNITNAEICFSDLVIVKTKYCVIIKLVF